MTASRASASSPVPLRAVQRAIAEQFPRLADLEVRALETDGTDNAIVAVGPEIIARIPRRPGDPAELHALLRREAAAQAEFAEISPVPAPRPLGIGTPGSGLDRPWSLQTRVPGAVATPSVLADSMRFAEDLADLVAALRAAETRGRRFQGPGRGGSLTDHDDWVRECLDRSVGLLDVPLLRQVWSQLRTTAETGRVTMSHRDLIPGNLLVSRGRLAGVIDTGGFAAADSALDLIVGIHLLDQSARDAFRERLEIDDLEWRRALAWAFEQAIGLVWYYRETVPAMSSLGRSTLERVIEEWQR
ncbi:phosphotransferase [Brachybacterium sp. GCM10030267]|uniref:phosphotransferase n=1 Tax=Brachybacterium sp. GCM10030267 TaxID=3273381 RepID=UPI00361106E2